MDEFGRFGLGFTETMFAGLVLAKMFRVEPVASWSWWLVLWPAGVFSAVFVAAAISVVLEEVRRRGK